jgi:hypothetical protein
VKGLVLFRRELDLLHQLAHHEEVVGRIIDYQDLNSLVVYFKRRTYYGLCLERRL